MSSELYHYQTICCNNNGSVGYLTTPPVEVIPSISFFLIQLISHSYTLRGDSYK